MLVDCQRWKMRTKTDERTQTERCNESQPGSKHLAFVTNAKMSKSSENEKQRQPDMSNRASPSRFVLPFSYSLYPRVLRITNPSRAKKSKCQIEQACRSCRLIQVKRLASQVQSRFQGFVARRSFLFLFCFVTSASLWAQFIIEEKQGERKNQRDRCAKSSSLAPAKYEYVRDARVVQNAVM